MDAPLPVHVSESPVRAVPPAVAIVDAVMANIQRREGEG